MINPDFETFYHWAINQKYPVACWRKPEEVIKHIIVQKSEKIEEKVLNIQDPESGFLVVPFSNLVSPSYFVKADIHAVSDQDEFVLKKGKVDEVFNSENEKQSLNYYPSERMSEEQKIDFAQLVEEGIESIKEGRFEKVVLARNKYVQLPSGFKALEAFGKLCDQYPAAFISLVCIPNVGTWIGASPETLIHHDQEGGFHTVSLAGTQARNGLQNFSEALWSQKEIEEQALVSRYIINCFKKVRVREFEEKGPKTVAAGNLLHLKTFFKVDTTIINRPDLAETMLQLLHPTSAVCGMPKEPATSFIENHEGFDRKFFSGYLGPVNLEQDTHLFVNLRCMELYQDTAKLYSGAGITADSNPEKEFKETEMKMDIIKKALL